MRAAGDWLLLRERLLLRRHGSEPSPDSQRTHQRARQQAARRRQRLHCWIRARTVSETKVARPGLSVSPPEVAVAGAAARTNRRVEAPGPTLEYPRASLR